MGINAEVKSYLVVKALLEFRLSRRQATFEQH